MYLTQIVSVVGNALSIASPKIHTSLEDVVKEIVGDESQNIERDHDSAGGDEERQIFSDMRNDLEGLSTQINGFFAGNDNEDQTLVIPSVWAGSALNDEGRDWVIMPLKAA